MNEVEKLKEMKEDKEMRDFMETEGWRPGEPSLEEAEAMLKRIMSEQSEHPLELNSECAIKDSNMTFQPKIELYDLMVSSMLGESYNEEYRERRKKIEAEMKDTKE